MFLEFLLCPLQPALVGEGKRVDQVKLEIIWRQEDTLASQMPQIAVCSLGFAVSTPAALCFISFDSLFVTWALRQSYMRLQFNKQNKQNKSRRLCLQSVSTGRREELKHPEGGQGEAGLADARGVTALNTGAQGQPECFYMHSCPFRIPFKVVK